ncbi:MAG: hypothetical protein HYW88_03485, partial [Candidatus Sungbacteria bacterium]|nr:hypothetical protein [Candidatus Sungbacteria bacterium]
MDSAFASGEDILISGLSWGATSTAFAASTTISLNVDGGVTGNRSDTATATIAVKGIITLADHDVGQLSDQFESDTSTTTELLRFKLTPNGESASTTVQFIYNTTGIADVDITSGGVYSDTDNNGRVNGAEAVAMACQAPSGNIIKCYNTANATTTITGGTNFIYRAAVAALAAGDAITIQIASTSDVFAFGLVSKTYSSRLKVSTTTQITATHTRNSDAQIFMKNPLSVVDRRATSSIPQIKVLANGSSQITPTKDIRIQLDRNFPLIWDATACSASTTPTFGGTAFGKVNAANTGFVCTNGKPQDLYIDVASDFVTNDDLLIPGSISWAGTSTAHIASTSIKLSINGGVSPLITATATIAVKGVITLADHDEGQLTDQFETETSTTTELIRFKLTPNGENASGTIRLTYSGSGVVDGDITSGNIFEDTNSNGRFNLGEPEKFGCSAPSGNNINCTASTTLVSAGANYFYRASVANLVAGDSLTFNAVGIANIWTYGSTSQTNSTSTLTVTGSTGAITHTRNSDAQIFV